MLLLGSSTGLRYIQIYTKHVYEVFCSKYQTDHSSHASYPSISLPVSKVLILGYKALNKKRGAELMGDPAATV